MAAAISAGADVRSRENRMNTKQIIKNIPVVGPVARCVYRTWINPPRPFHGSDSYWKDRYETGGNSGAGSYNQLSEFKAEVLVDRAGEYEELPRFE